MLLFSDEDKEGTEDGFYKHITPMGLKEGKGNRIKVYGKVMG